MTNNRSSSYRNVYRKYFGEVPRDSQGRAYDIHHEDGDRHNNDPMNLLAVSIETHFWIHWLMGDVKGYTAIAIRMKQSPIDLSEAASRRELEKVAAGRHHFQGSDLNDRLKREGRHPFVGGLQSSKNARKLVAEGRHPFSGGHIQRKSNAERIANGTHNLLGGAIVRKQFAQGTHNFQKRGKCGACGYEGRLVDVLKHQKKRNHQ